MVKQKYERSVDWLGFENVVIVEGEREAMS
jgi:hypothetical protein